MSQPIAPVPVDGGAPTAAGQAVNVSGAPSRSTIAVARMHTKSQDPALQPYGRREYAPKERCGACYGTQVGFEAHVDPTAGLTQANGRILAPAVNRTAPNFGIGISENL